MNARENIKAGEKQCLDEEKVDAGPTVHEAIDGDHKAKCESDGVVSTRPLLMLGVVQRKLDASLNRSDVLARALEVQLACTERRVNGRGRSVRGGPLGGILF